MRARRKEMHPPPLANETHVAFTVYVAEIIYLDLAYCCMTCYNPAFTDLLMAAIKIAQCH